MWNGEQKTKMNALKNVDVSFRLNGFDNSHFKISFSEQKSPSDDELEGVLSRKHEWESTTKKATNRSWDKVYMVVRGQNLSVYKDQKSYKASPDLCYKGEAPLDLRGATITVANDYTKRKHVFRVKYVLFERAN